MLDQLPDELLVFIFHKLDLLDFANCRLVSKKFEQLIRSTKLAELIVVDDDGKKCPSWYEKWQFTDDLSNFRNEIMVDTSLIWKFPFRVNNLTRLKINMTIEADESNMSLVSSLSNLKQLEISSLLLVNWNASLVLPVLKLLYIGDVWVNDAYGNSCSFDSNDVPRYQVNVDAPQLKALGCYMGYASPEGPVSLNILHPESIEHLEVVPSPGMDLRMFRNVTRFECGNMCQQLSRKLMTFFPKLQELHFGQDYIGGADDAEAVADIMNHFVSQRKRKWLKKQHVKIYFQDTELIDDKIFEDYDIDLHALIEQ